ncbi:hypothetical protein SPOG_02924 [Schizosaccharomyces cryophilus OY26]|uniref:Uncharacterized protein n=1 Tax=Schizosaccharomyces cryophilus (strain OY26 / ATCC MYA-4695 / CBS 11777 / NBRC 106824 / NRRL Y48691) TaxID=653667 RepID=S9XJH8_SCHCR|nr:uncharacterized protein SPOG_02924 [Schizosaccharomyces cryophilus OY26]EPY53846.1 hypothetical protein SPOG_02924 [Schizosaccharomyces cryophilus OY26]
MNVRNRKLITAGAAEYADKVHSTVYVDPIFEKDIRTHFLKENIPLAQEQKPAQPRPSIRSPKNILKRNINFLKSFINRLFTSQKKTRCSNQKSVQISPPTLVSTTSALALSAMQQPECFNS